MNDKKDVITFIIVTWNNSDVIIDCLESIYKYCEKFKIIIIDNNSSDNTVKLINSKKYKNCIVVDLKENLGFAKGNNYALSMVETDYICYLNPDTILLEDIINPSIDILKSNSDIGIVGSKLLYKDLRIQPSAFNFVNNKQAYIEGFRLGKFFPNFIKEKYFPNDSKGKQSKIVDWIIGAEMILSTNDAKKIEGFSEEYYMYVEDMDICKKMQKILNKQTYYDACHKLIHIGGTSEAKNVNYNKLEMLIKNKVKFSEKFDGLDSAKKTIKALYNVYAIRLFLIKSFYWFNKQKRNYYIEKMNVGKEISKKISLKLQERR